MKPICIRTCIALVAVASLTRAAAFPLPQPSVQAAFADRPGAFVLVDCATDAVSVFRPAEAAERLPPCSTFKIWNALIGLECGLLSAADEAFYKWDGVTRFLPDWNRDLTLRDAFRASCVPAFQALARKIGPERMQLWLDRIGYGDRNTSAGIDVFWLTSQARSPLLISPEEQARLMGRLATGRLPFSDRSRQVLRDLMTVRKTERAVLCGKTGSGVDAEGTYVLGWFVGFLETQGRTYAFACTAKGKNVMGKDARAITETVLERNGFL